MTTIRSFMSTSVSDFQSSLTADKLDSSMLKSWQDPEDEYKAELLDYDDDPINLLNLHIDDIVFFWVNF